MALLSSNNNRKSGEKIVSNGGVGGFLPLRRSSERRTVLPVPDGLSKRGQTRPSPVFAGRANTAEKLKGDETSPSPRTPSNRSKGTARLNFKSMPVTPLLVSRFNSSSEDVGWLSPDETPVSPLKEAALPVELHGSLLLSSQGFPQSEPPQTPVRQRRSRTNSDESVTSVPGLTNSPSSVTDSEGESMGKLSSIPTTIKHYKKPSIAATTKMHSPNYDHNATSKPFTAMTPEELLDILPGLKPVAIAQLWMPAMKTHLQKIKASLQHNCDETLSSNIKVVDMAQDLKAFADSTKSVSSTYQKAVASAESLLERDTQQLKNKLQTAETNLAEALMEIKKDEEKIDTQAEMISQLRSTLLNVVHVLGDFIQGNLDLYRMPSNKIEATRVVMRIIQEFSAYNYAYAEKRHVRIAEDTYSANLIACREIHAKLHKYKDVVREQSSVIQEQGDQLENQGLKCEGAMELVKQRDREIALLKQENEEMQREHETGSIERDEQITQLRQKVGSLREEVTARRLEDRSLASHNQTLSERPPIIEESVNKPSAPVLQAARRLFTSDKGKSRPGLPLSQSMMALGLPKVNTKLEPNLGSDSEQGYSSKEVAIPNMECFPPTSSRSREKPSFGCSTSTNPHLQRSHDSFPDLPARPRVDSLNAMTQTTKSLLPSPALSSLDLSIEKELPATPLLSTMPSVHLSTTKAALRQYQNETEPHRRILSLVPERSVEDLEAHENVTGRSEKHSSGSYSATSSDREVYRRSINALGLLDGGTSDENTDDVIRSESEFENAELGIARAVNVGVTARARRPAVQSTDQRIRKTMVIANSRGTNGVPSPKLRRVGGLGSKGA